MAENQGGESSAEIMPQIPEDWKLNVFLSKLQDRLGEADVVKMKDMLSGVGGLGREIYLEIKTVADLFSFLKTSMMISNGNVTILQALVWHVGRPELFDDMVNFVGELDMSDRTQHIVCPVKKPENGYKHVKFHLRGAMCLDKGQLEAVRARISYLMCVPLQFITVHDIEPSGSWIITFMVPEICVSVLLDRAKTHAHWFTSLDIDRFEVDGEVMTIETDSAITQSPRDLDDTLVKENQRLRERVETLAKRKEQLEISSIQQNRRRLALEEERDEMMNLYEKQQEFTEFVFGVFLMAIVYLNMFKKTFMEGASLGLNLQNGTISKLESALAAFKRSMEKVRKERYDVELIDDLLESFRFFAMKRHLEELRLSQFILSDSVGGKQHCASTNGAFFQYQASPAVIEITGMGFSPHFLKILRDVSNCLHKHERSKIMSSTKEVSLTVEEKQLLNKDSGKDKLLEVILSKKIQYFLQSDRDSREHPDKLVKALLEHVNRRDLAKKMEEDIQKARETALIQATDSAYQILVEGPMVRLSTCV